MEHIKHIADESEFYKTQRVTQFSDCMVVSYSVNERSAVFDLINDIGFFVVDLVERGFLLRGAVTVGKLLHTKDHVLGPAMVRAYELESSIAKYPRVIVGPEVFEIAKARPARHHTGEEELGYVRGFLREDEDGQHYVDYISWDAVVATIGADSDDYPRYLNIISELVRNGLNHAIPSVQEKFLWLHRHYMAAIKVFEETPGDHPFRIENPGVCEYILSLPGFKNEAAKAKMNVIEAAAKN